MARGGTPNYPIALPWIGRLGQDGFAKISKMSTIGPKRTRRPAAFVSAFGGKADTNCLDGRGSQ